MRDGDHYKDKSLLSQIWYSDLDPKDTACEYRNPLLHYWFFETDIKKKTDFRGNSCSPFIDIEEEDDDENGRSMNSRTEKIQ